MNIVLMDIIPMDTTPMDIIPMISMTMDPVTHHHIAKVPKTTIAKAVAHHLGTPKKEVQVTDTFTSTGDQLDIFTDFLH